MKQKTTKKQGPAIKSANGPFAFNFQPPATNHESGPIKVDLKGTTEKKLQAIADLATTVRNLSSALTGITTHVTVSHCSFKGDGTKTPMFQVTGE